MKTTRRGLFGMLAGLFGGFGAVLLGRKVSQNLQRARDAALLYGDASLGPGVTVEEAWRAEIARLFEVPPRLLETTEPLHRLSREINDDDH